MRGCLSLISSLGYFNFFRAIGGLSCDLPFGLGIAVSSYFLNDGLVVDGADPLHDKFGVEQVG